MELNIYSSEGNDIQLRQNSCSQFKIFLVFCAK